MKTLLLLICFVFIAVTLQQGENCAEGWFWNFKNSSCSPCPNGPGTRSCFSKSTEQPKAFECLPKNYLENGICKKCYEGCFSCLNNLQEGCPSLLVDFVLDTEKYKITSCNSGSNLCRICENPNACKECNSGYSVKDGKCFPDDVKNNCMARNSINNNCIQCFSGFYLNDKQECQICKENCQVCSADGKCTKCNDNYKLVSKDGQNECQMCFQKTSGAESDIKENCAECADTPPKTYSGSSYNYKCLSCPSHTDSKLKWYLNSELPIFCLRIPSSCKYSTEPDMCTGECVSGYYKADVADKQCKSCPARCSICSLDSNKQIKCTQCEKGFYLDQSGQCQLCASPCEACTNETNCIDCSDGWYLSGGKCQPCLNGCNDCVGSAFCSNCNTGLYLSSDRKSCEGKCPNGQKAVVETKVVWKTTALDSFRIWSGSCRNCIDDKCKECTKLNSRCEQCVEGYKTWARQNETICIPEKEQRSCHTDCLTCKGEGPQDCLSCKSGLYFNEATSSCTEFCPVGTYNSTDKVCRKCEDSACVRCNVTHCLECRAGFYEQTDGSCKKCFQDCASCSDSMQCDQCSSGLLVNYNEFSESSAACLKECALGFLQDVDDRVPGDCVPCRLDCKKGCAPGLSLYLGNCIPQCPFSYVSKFNSTLNYSTCELMGDKEIATIRIEPNVNTLSIYRNYKFNALYGSSWNVTSILWQVYKAKNEDEISKETLKYEGRSEAFNISKGTLAPETEYLLMLNISYKRNESSLKSSVSLPLRTTASRFETGYFRVTPLKGSVPSTRFQVEYGDLASVKDRFQYVVEAKDGNRVLARVSSFWLSASMNMNLPYVSKERNVTISLTMSNFVTRLVKSIQIYITPDRASADDLLKQNIEDLQSKKDVSDYLNTYLNVKQLKLGTDAALQPNLFAPTDDAAKKLFGQVISRLTKLTDPLESGMGLETVLPLISPGSLIEASFSDSITLLKNFINGTVQDVGAISTAVEFGANLIGLVPNFTRGSATQKAIFELVDAIDDIFLDVYDEVESSFSSINSGLTYTVHKLYQENSQTGQTITVSKTQGVGLLNTVVLLPGIVVGDGSRLARVAIWAYSPYTSISSRKVYTKMVTVDVADALSGRELFFNISKTPVTIQIPKDIQYYDTDLKAEDISCSWFDRKILDWNDEGCVVKDVKKLSVECECLHLSDFAVTEKIKSSSKGNFGARMTSLLFVWILALFCLISC